jgi:2-keto-4-pentenoate hydratase/2-oxohepta-3-ene-1,7-dioic acid hydratase in catechol pathway
MAFDIPTLLAYISGVMTLEPGRRRGHGTPGRRRAARRR